jgi:hypothetical protein
MSGFCFGCDWKSHPINAAGTLFAQSFYAAGTLFAQSINFVQAKFPQHSSREICLQQSQKADSSLRSE